MLKSANGDVSMKEVAIAEDENESMIEDETRNEKKLSRSQPSTQKSLMNMR